MSVRNALLALVSLQPAGAYRLRQMFEDQTCGTWPLNIGQAYQAMQRLECTGRVAPHQEINAGRDSEVFEITDVSRTILGEWWSTPVTYEQPERDKFVTEPAVAAADPSVNVAPLIQMQRRAARAVLREATHMNEGAGDGELAWKFILESRIFELEAESKWLNYIEMGAVSQASRRADSTTSKRRPRRDTA